MKDVTSKTIDGIADLVVVAPIKPGVIDAFENLTYESRLSIVAEALHKIRVNAREHETAVPFADTVERILTLFNFRIGIIDAGTLGLDLTEADRDTPDGTTLFPKRFMFLAATFDGPLEPYLRLIWKPLGPFLDLLLCNCEGYKFASEVGFPEYLDWVRKHQIEPAIFYSTSGLTLRDQFYLPQLEKLQRDGNKVNGGPADDQKLAAMTFENPEEKARKIWEGDEDTLRTSFRLSFEALNVLYRLSDYFPADREEGDVLLLATRDLLSGLENYVDRFKKHPEIGKMLTLYGVLERPGPFTEQWRWLLSGKTPGIPSPREPKVPLGEVQKGLLSPYEDDDHEITHSAVMMFSIRDRKKAALAIKILFMPTFEDEALAQPGSLWRYPTSQGLAFTPRGLEKMNLDKQHLNAFPREFVEGMFKRAPMLGDVRHNHPRRWEFPLRRDLFTGAEDDGRPAIHTEEVDLIFQLRIAKDLGRADLSPIEFIDFEAQSRELETKLREEDLFEKFVQDIPKPQTADLASTQKDKQTPRNAESELRQMEKQISAAFSYLGILQNKDSSWFNDIFNQVNPIAILLLILTQISDLIGLQLLSAESGYRQPNNYDHSKIKRAGIREHFGFVDGISQPNPNAPKGDIDKVRFGDLLVGLPNSMGDRERDLRDFQHAGPIPLTYGSFMVIRKIAQYPERMEQLKKSNGPDVDEMIVGRRRDGEPLINQPSGKEINDFTYENDGEQKQCPFSAHVRLANPRDAFQGRPAPRILRRGFSYGQRYDQNSSDSDSEDRGTLFMAYNASLSEQYEVIQRWLNRGNPTGVSSAANDPLTGVMQEDDGYTFRYRKAGSGKVERTHIGEPLTDLKWGLYAFVPSRSGIEAICKLGLEEQQSNNRRPDDHNSKLQRKIDLLLKQSDEVQRLEWKRLIEDAAVKDPAKGNELQDVWALIRNSKNGVLRLKSGIAFGGENLPDQEQEDNNKPAVLVARWEDIRKILSNPQTYSVKEQGRRTAASIGDSYVAMDPDPEDSVSNRISRYAKEAIDTNEVVMNFGKTHADDVFHQAYNEATKQLKGARDFSAQANTRPGDANPFFKVELRRDFLAPVFGRLCNWLFDIPDASIRKPREGYIDHGPWGTAKVDLEGHQQAGPGLRKPRCPADFMAPSRRNFYPRPTSAIIDYGTQHGTALKNAARNLIGNRAANGAGFSGQISSKLADILLPKNEVDKKAEDLLAGNIIGLMEGMLPPLDGLMRGIVFDWINRDTIWEQQSRYFECKKDGNVKLGKVEKALKEAVESAIRKRPSPDLIYRTATRDTHIGDQEIEAGDLIILALGSAMQEPKAAEYHGIWPVFGGERKCPFQEENTPTHACPAQPIVMAVIYGMIAALFDAGRIVVQPASLILQISDWGGKDGNGSKDGGDDAPPFSPFT